MIQKLICSTEELTDFYDAALLTRWCTQLAHFHYIDSEINHIRHYQSSIFNKGTKYMNLSSIYKSKYIISSNPTYFENRESPISFFKKVQYTYSY